MANNSEPGGSIMPASRKTRQQKINATQRKEVALPISSQNVESSNTTPAISAHDSMAAAHAYVGTDLRRIGWISLLCLTILAVATFLMADNPALNQLRRSLPGMGHYF